MTLSLVRAYVQVAMTMRGGPGGECVVSGFNISLTRSDLHSLVGLNWLNDNVSSMLKFFLHVSVDAHIYICVHLSI